jgi:predicted Ser/Thr protein kinase
VSDAEHPNLAGRYQLLEPIGEGSFSITWRAKDAVLGRDVAIKVLRAQFVQNLAFSARFENEARAAALISHPNVIPVFDYGRDNGSLYIVMEYVAGPTFKEFLRNEAPLAVDEAIEFTRQILEGLGVIHDAGIIHRDVKPQNVLMVHERLVKLTDFGIARVDTAHAGLTDAGTALGTAAYMAPEQASGQGVAPATDLYAVGVMLYEMLTGRLPFVGDNPVQVMYRHVNDVPQPPRMFNRQIPVTLEALILKSLAKEPGDRYPTARSMRDALISPGPARSVRLPQTDPDQVTAVAAAVAGADNDAESTARRRAVAGAAAAGAAAAGAGAARAASGVPTRATGTFRVPPPPVAPPPSAWTADDEPDGRRSGWLVGVVLVLLLAAVLLVGAIYALTSGDDPDDDAVAEATATTEIATEPSGVGEPTATETETPAEPTATATLEPTATATLEPPTATLEPTATLAPTETVAPTETPEPPPTETPVPPTATTEPTATTPPAPTTPFNTPLPMNQIPASYFQNASRTFDAGDFEGAYRRDDGELYDLPAIHLYGQASDFASASVEFDVNDEPSNYILITIVGLDDERSEHTTMRLRLNGNTVWEGPSPFANESWTEVAWIVGNLQWLNDDDNVLTIENVEGGGGVGQTPWFLVTTAAVYFD